MSRARISNGFAIKDGRIYFGHGTELNSVAAPSTPTPFVDDFNSETTGGQPSRWKTQSGTGTSVSIDTTVFRGTGGNSVHLLDQSSTYAQIQHTNTAMDTVYYKASVRFKGTNQYSYVLLGNRDNNSIRFLIAYKGQWLSSNGTTETWLGGGIQGEPVV